MLCRAPRCGHRFPAKRPRGRRPNSDRRRHPAGLTHTLRSPYLLNICPFILLFTILSTFLYFQQAAIAHDVRRPRRPHAILRLQIDLLVNVLTLVITGFPDQPHPRRLLASP